VKEKQLTVIYTFISVEETLPCMAAKLCNGGTLKYGRSRKRTHLSGGAPTNTAAHMAVFWYAMAPSHIELTRHSTQHALGWHARIVLAS